MSNLMEKHLKEYGHHFERSLNPKLYDELYGDYVPDESPSERIEDVIPFNSETVSDASYVRPSEVRMYSEKTPVLEPLDESKLTPLSDDESEKLDYELLHKNDRHVKEDELVNSLAIGMFAEPLVLSAAGLGAAINQAKYTPDLMTKGYVRLRDWGSGAFRRFPQYVQVRGTTDYVPTSLAEYTAMARKAGYKIKPESTIGTWKHPKKVWTSPKHTGTRSITRQAEFTPTGKWINVRKPLNQLTEKQKIYLGLD